MAKTICRRKFPEEGVLSAAGIVLGNAVTGCASKSESVIIFILLYQKIPDDNISYNPW